MKLIQYATTLLLAAMTTFAAQPSSDATRSLAHTETSFDLTLHAPMKSIAPLFGAEKERAWAGGDWNPAFVYPVPAADKKGAVFTIKHGEHSATWICTAFDLESGYFQYAYIIPEIMVTLIDVHLNKRDADTTAAHVVYQRTALTPEGNEHVDQFTESDRKAGPIWEQAINTHIASSPNN
jgi:hypothetical protein